MAGDIALLVGDAKAASAEKMERPAKACKAPIEVNSRMDRRVVVVVVVVVVEVVGGGGEEEGSLVGEFFILSSLRALRGMPLLIRRD